MLMSGFDGREVVAAAQDAVALMVGEKVRHPHPISAQLKMKDVAVACALAKRKRYPGQDERSLMALGLTTVEFSKILANGVSQLLVRTYDKQSEHTAFCANVEVKNFKPVELPALDADLSLEPLAENAEISQAQAEFIAAGATGAALRTFARLVLLSRELVINDQLDGFGRLVASLGASAGRLEARMVAETLVANGVLDDGQTVFDLSGSDKHNNVCPQGLQAGLGDAFAKLRKQKTSEGQLLNLSAKHLVVAPDLEATARTVIADWGLGLTVSVLAYLPDGRWFVLADKEVHPVVGTLKLASSTSPVRVQEITRRPVNMDGSGVKVIADLGAVMLGRTGIVIGGADLV